MFASRKPTAPQEETREVSVWGRISRGMAGFEVDHAVAYSLLARGWQFVAGPVTLVLIARFFSPELQGYFYTFASLMGLQILFELGLHSVVINTSSHEWSRLRWVPGQGLQGDEQARQRLISFGRQSLGWYAGASLLFLMVIGSSGWFFLDGRELPANDWGWQWVALVLVTAAQLWTMPLVSILEGCNQVLAVNRLRAVQAILGNFVVWTVVVLGGGLWAVVGSAAVKLSCELFLVAWTYRSFFGSFWERPNGSSISWRNEVWPLQWSLALHSVLQYLAYFMFVPILFHFHGPIMAGQMGMTWTILTTMQYAAFSWVQTRTPKFGMLVARREFAELDRVFVRAAGISCAVLFSGCVAFGLAVAVLPQVPHPWARGLSERLLPILPTLLFSGSVFLIGIFQCLVSYLLAHKRNPLLPVSVLGNLATIGGVVIAGAFYGAVGAGSALLIVLMFWTLPAAGWVWQSSRQAWQRGGL